MVTGLRMSDTSEAIPKIIIPFTGDCSDETCQDIVVYLRPETNGIQVESALFKVLKSPQWESAINLRYLANLPGEFIMRQRIVENHYYTRVDFAAQGRAAFTPAMKETFTRFFGVPFEKARIYGAFEALRMLQISPEQLFQLWVPVYDILEIQGQLIKRTADNLFIINYDIPALLHKNHAGTDVAVMLFRTALTYEQFRPVIEQMRQALIAEGILDPEKPERRVFHYSKGPFEQLLDGLGYIYLTPEQPAQISDLNFGCYLRERGVSEEKVIHLMKYPIGKVHVSPAVEMEQNIFSYTLFDSYELAYQKFLTWSPLSLENPD